MTVSIGRPAIFLDRDGTLIEDVGYPFDPTQVRLLDGAADALLALRECGFALVVVSNQSGIGRGLVTPEQAQAVHRQFVHEMNLRGVHFDDVRYCPHAPEAGCACRKPRTELLLAAAREHRLDLARSFMVGDSPVDVGAGRAAGCRTVGLGNGALQDADYVAARWPEALAHIVSSTQ
jgi:D-glycero-D-manno-heptose 1,7-bisphosphate phosphatase